MSLVVHFDPHTVERKSFDETLNLVRSLGGTLDSHLNMLAYGDLHRATSADAGDNRCPVDLIRAERERRRLRFVDCSADELEAARVYLVIERAYTDVVRARAERHAPS